MRAYSILCAGNIKLLTLPNTQNLDIYSTFYSGKKELL